MKKGTALTNSSRSHQSHDAVVRVEDGGVGGEVGGGAGQGLHVHAPRGRVEPAGGKKGGKKSPIDASSAQLEQND